MDELIKCPLHQKLAMAIVEVEMQDTKFDVYAGPERVTYIDGLGNRTFSRSLYGESNASYKIHYKCPHGCEFIAFQNKIHTQDLNRGISRQSRREVYEF